MKQYLVIRPLTAEVIPIESHTVFTQQSSKSVCFSHNFEDTLPCNNAKGGIWLVGEKAVLGTAFAS